jgi:hypothetical protein
MVPNNPSSADPNLPPVASAPAQPPKKGRWLLYGCGGLLALLLLIVGTVAITIWWIQRPIKPVVLSEKEKATVDAKLYLPHENMATPPPQVAAGTSGDRSQHDHYVPGSKAVTLTEREINGLLNANTDLGKSVRLEFAKDAINAYLVVPIPQDFPVGGGKMFRARGRFRLSVGNDGAPYAILEDVTVFGVSLPKAWLGGLKGENLLADATGQRNGKPALKGIKSLRVEPGALVLELEE